MNEKINYEIKKVNIYKKDIPPVITSILESVFVTMCICLVCIIAFSFVYIYVPVEGYSMYPTLNEDINGNKDSIYINKFAGFSNQDIIVVKREKKYVIKRVLATGGDKIAFVKHRINSDEEAFYYSVYLIKNGETEKKILNEPYILATCDKETAYQDFLNLENKYSSLVFTTVFDNSLQMNVKYLTIFEKQIFYVGDNRGSASEDCTDYGPVEEKNVVGRVDIIIKNSTNKFYQILKTCFQKIFN